MDSPEVGLNILLHFATRAPQLLDFALFDRCKIMKGIGEVSREYLGQSHCTF